MALLDVCRAGGIPSGWETINSMRVFGSPSHETATGLAPGPRGPLPQTKWMRFCFEFWLLVISDMVLSRPLGSSRAGAGTYQQSPVQGPF